MKVLTGLLALSVLGVAKKARDYERKCDFDSRLKWINLKKRMVKARLLFVQRATSFLARTAAVPG